MNKASGNQKKIYELQWRYLQQSDAYKEWLETFAKAYDDWKAWWAKHAEATDNDRRKHALKSRRFNPKWTTLYDLIGNVHKVSFEEWWKRKKHRLDNTTPIDDYTNWAGYEVNNCWINMKNRPSDPGELEKQFCTEFVERMKKSPDLYLIVNPDGDLEMLKTRFVSMVNQKKKENKDFYQKVREFKYPIAGKIRIDELEKYLEILILKRKKTWKEIILPLMENYKSPYRAVLRKHKRYLKNARAIIRNAEIGRFPGDYQSG